MKKEEHSIRSQVIKIRVSEQEKKLMLVLLRKSTDKSLSHYLRKLALQKPITIRYRNDAADDFLRDMIGLKKELSAIGNNFNQAVHKLHTLERIPEFRVWIQEQHQQHRKVVNSIDAIRKRIDQLYEQWLQK